VESKRNSNEKIPVRQEPSGPNISIERDLEVKEGVLSALDYAHDQCYSSPIWDEEERFDLSLFYGYRDPLLVLRRIPH